MMLNLMISLAGPDKPTAEAPPGAQFLQKALNWALWVVDGLCVLAVIVAGAMMALASRRGEGGEHASRLGWIIAGAILVGSAAALANQLTAG